MQSFFFLNNILLIKNIILFICLYLFIFYIYVFIYIYILYFIFLYFYLYNKLFKISDGKHLIKQNEKELHDLIDHSCFPVKESKSLWHEAFNHYFTVLEIEDNQKIDEKDSFQINYHYLVFMNAILPIFEHALRCLYVAVNQLKEIRFLTANTYEYYIIIDTIFNQDLLIDETVSSSKEFSGNEIDSSNVKNIMGLQSTELKSNLITKLMKPSYIVNTFKLTFI